MSELSTASPDLTKNQALVMGALSDAHEPLSAYTILDRLRDQGFRAPPQVYRALEKLMEFGLVHRVESLNAFVVCRQPDCESCRTIVFAICDDCGQVREISGDELSGKLTLLANSANFAVKESTVELRGLCDACRPQ